MTHGDPPTDWFVPGGVDELVAYVDSVDAPVVALRLRDGGHRRTVLATGVTRHAADADGPAVEVRGVAEGSAGGPLPVSGVEAVGPVADAATATGLLPADDARRAAVLRGLGEAAPALVDVAAVLGVFDGGDRGAVRDALASLAAVADERPEDCLAALPRVRTLATDADAAVGVRAGALTCLAALAAARPAEVAPHVDCALPALETAEPALALPAVACVSHVAGADPGAVVDGTDALVGLLAVPDADARMHAAYALGRVASVAPAAIREETGRLARVVADESERPATRLNATCAVGRVAGEWPGAVVDHLSTFVDGLEAASPGVRANAAGVIGDVATTHAVAVRGHVAPLVARLDDDDGVTRANASTALARVAREFPDALRGHVDSLVARLDDEEALVRENACWALGYLREGARDARPALRRLEADDGDRSVRERAGWALAEVGGDGADGPD